MDNIEFEIPKYKVYIKTDSKNRIKEVNSSVFINDLTDWIEIDEGTGDKYAHAQNGYFENPLVNMDGTHNYIYEDGKVRETTDNEKEEEKASFPIVIPSSPTGKGWSEKERYTEGKYVIDENALYKCLITNSGIKPSTSSVYWEACDVASVLNEIENKIE